MSKSEKFIIREYHENDEEQIVPLLEQVFPGWPGFDLTCSTIDHWKWKNLDTPLGEAPIIVAEKDGQIIGVDHGSFLCVKIGDEVCLCEHSTDLATHQDFRGMGVFTRINRMKQEKIHEYNTCIAYGTSENPIVVKHDSKHNKHPFPKPCKYLFKIDNIDEFIKNREKIRSKLPRVVIKYLIYLAKVQNKIARAIIFSHRSTSNNNEIRKIHRFDERINVFWDNIKDSYNFIVEKNKDYLNWRYCDPRGGNYTVLQAESQGQILGYIVLRINKVKPEYPVGYIIEVIALRDRNDVVEELVSSAVDYFYERNINVVQAMIIQGNIYERLLFRHGFLDTRRKSFISYRIHKQNLSFNKFTNALSNSINYQYGEYDSI